MSEKFFVITKNKTEFLNDSCEWRDEMHQAFKYSTFHTAKAAANIVMSQKISVAAGIDFGDHVSIQSWCVGKYDWEFIEEEMCLQVGLNKGN